MTTREQALRALNRKLKAYEAGQCRTLIECGLKPSTGAWRFAYNALVSARYYIARRKRATINALRRAIASLDEGAR